MTLLAPLTLWPSGPAALPRTTASNSSGRSKGSSSGNFRRCTQARQVMAATALGQPHEAQAPANVQVPAAVTAVLRKQGHKLDPEAPQFIQVLQESAASEIWHKHGSFYDHLHDVWEVLCVWQQPQSWCRLGLFHSAYSNSFVSMNLFDPKTDRPKLQQLIGSEAENLVYKFCVIDRKLLEETVLEEQTIREEGYDMVHIRTGETVHLSLKEATACIVETLADFQEQSFGWQTELEAGFADALWPGMMPPTLRMSMVSRLASAARNGGALITVPPIFDSCTTILDEEAEKQALEAYWHVVKHSKGMTPAEALDMLEKCAKQNPFVGEPHLVMAQLFMQKEQWEAAVEAADKGLAILYSWGTTWDKRMPYQAWIAWGRCVRFQATLGEWPNSWGGMESLGAVHASQRFRSLNTADRSLTRDMMNQSAKG